MMEFTKQYPVIRYEDGRETPSMDEVLAECCLLYTSDAADE